MARRKGSKDKQPRKRSALATLGKGTLVGAGLGAGLYSGGLEYGLRRKKGVKRLLVEAASNTYGRRIGTGAAKDARKAIGVARALTPVIGGVGGAIYGAGLTGAGLGVAHLLRKRNKNKR